MNYISIYGFKTEADLGNNNEVHIDSITEDGDWVQDAKNIVADNQDKFYHISVQSDDGRELPEFES